MADCMQLLACLDVSMRVEAYCVAPGVSDKLFPRTVLYMLPRGLEG